MPMNSDLRVPARHLDLGDHQVELNGVSLHYRVAGDGPPLFVIPPGWGVGNRYLQNGLGFLQRNFRLLWLDTRGSGLSGRPADDAKMGTQDMADDLEALREYLGLPSVRVVGHSNSGAIALSYAERYPDRVNKMVLIGSQVLGFGAADETQKILQARAGDPRYESAVQAAASFFSGKTNPTASDTDLTAFVEQTLPLFLHDPEKYLPVLREHMSGEVESYAFRAQNAADRGAAVDQTALLDRVRASVLILVGRHDWICPVPVSERLHAGIPGSRLVVFENSGHMPWVEERGAFAAELLEFLEGTAVRPQ
jgi:pimeloyl-ACP methyl ester carboxylesterase